MRRCYAVQDFFLKYFHEDWAEDHPSTMDAVREFAVVESRQAVLAVIDELDALLAVQLDDRSLHDLVLRDYSLSYDPWRDEIGMSDWLHAVRNELQRNVE